MSKIDTRTTDLPGWVVWSLHQNGNQSLNAICLERERANQYRLALENQPGIVKVWIELTRINHLYASMFEIPSDEKVHSLAKQLAILYRE